MVHLLIGQLGHLAVIIAFVAGLFSFFSFFRGASSDHPELQQGFNKTGRVIFYIHSAAVFLVVGSLFGIIYNNYFEYHYAWSHASSTLPVYYMVSSFWEGQEGSFLLWMFWNVILGLIIIRTNRQWQAPVMAVFCLVQAFLTSMIMGVVIPGIDLKIGSSPFMLLRDVMDAPIFATNPDFVPEDGTGLNPLLQNYWMVIHPPVLFLGFATTLVPFAFAIAGLWKKRFREWVRPALPWSIFSSAVLGLGILMGAYWAYETLNFGGYWSWDPVENAVYIPWLIQVAGIHTMITFRKSGSALKASVIFVTGTFILILYSTFLTRSGILGESSVHSFTDLGLSGQLLIYLLTFFIGTVALSIVRWKGLPTTAEEVSTYSREFWIFIGAAVLCLMSFQVFVFTSIPVFNAIAEMFGGNGNLAPPSDPEIFYTQWQMWLAIFLLLLSGTGQFFWWKKIGGKELREAIIPPAIISLLVASIILIVQKMQDPAYIILVTAGVYSIVSNATILFRVLKTSGLRLSGGSIAHIGVGLMLLGILFSSGYSNVISLNNTGLLYDREFPDEINKENLLLWLNQSAIMGQDTLSYRGQYRDVDGVPGYVPNEKLIPTRDPMVAIAKEAYSRDGKQYFSKGDSISYNSENTYYRVNYATASGRSFDLYPRVQDNPSMGFVVSPDIHRAFDKDLYTHVTVVSDPEDEKEWSETEENRVRVGENFFVNDYVASINRIDRVQEVEGVDLRPDDIAIKAQIAVQTGEEDLTLEPMYVLRVNEKRAGLISAEAPELGVRLSLMNIEPETETFTVGINTAQKDYIILKVVEKPLINILWVGTIVLMFGFGIAVYRRYTEFKKMRDKGLE
ncbi:heme lyase CcmF/NrfE family subunit [Roseivirga sp. BDSF3-8]|uniref:heme lyase CcmF/NrfE family subunit n=1 Tax=Roseivirga sp. BDSF3-8 TaxID=3241598 RepID=UPI0035323D14